MDDDGVARLFDGTRWKAEHVADGALYGVACPQTGFCVAVDDDGNAHVRRHGVWTGVPTAVACASDTLRLAVNENGYESAATSTDAPFNDTPSITRSGDTLTCDPGVWTGRPDLHFAWETDGRATVPGATGPTFTVTPTTAASVTAKALRLPTLLSRCLRVTSTARSTAR